MRSVSEVCAALKRTWLDAAAAALGAVRHEEQTRFVAAKPALGRGKLALLALLGAWIGAAAAQAPHDHRHGFHGASEWARVFDDPKRDAWQRPHEVITALRSTECACLLAALRARWPAVDVITGDGAYVDDDFLRRAGRAADGTYYVAFWHRSLPGASEGYVSRFTHAVQRAPRHGDAVFYDGVMLAAQAIRERGADRERVRAYLRELGQSRPAYDGIAGPVAFTPAIRRELLMTEVVGGAVRVVGSR